MTDVFDRSVGGYTEKRLCDRCLPLWYGCVQIYLAEGYIAPKKLKSVDQYFSFWRFIMSTYLSDSRHTTMNLTKQTRCRICWFQHSIVVKNNLKNQDSPFSSSCTTLDVTLFVITLCTAWHCTTRMSYNTASSHSHKATFTLSSIIQTVYCMRFHHIMP